jgi:hypothetical protein
MSSDHDPFDPDLARLAALAPALALGFARVESGADLLVNVRWSPWLLAPLGLATVALLLILFDLWRSGFGFWIEEMTGICVIALLALAAPFAVALVALILAFILAGVVKEHTRSR